MLQNAHLLAKIGADTAENERNFAEILPKICEERSAEEHEQAPLCADASSPSLPPPPRCVHPAPRVCARELRRVAQDNHNMKKNPEKTDQNHPVTPLRRADVESNEKKKSIETKITIIRKRTNEQTNKHNTHKHTNSQTYIQRR